MVSESYNVQYELPNGQQVNHRYDHRAAWKLEKGFMVWAEHGWPHAPVTIIEVERHPDTERAGIVKARLTRAPG